MVRITKYLIYLILLSSPLFAYGNIGESIGYTNFRNIRISGIELNIPRNFLIGSSSLKSNKDDKSILIAFTYPEIKGGMGNGYDFIQVFCQDLRDYFKRDGVTHSQHLVDQYWDNYLDIDTEHEIYKIKYKGINDDLERKHYRIEAASMI